MQFDNILSGAAPNPESVSAAAPRDRAAGSASRGAGRGAAVPQQKIFGILYKYLQVVQFLYLGDVTVPQHRLQAVLSTAQDLQIHQLRLIRLFPICSNGRFLEALYKCLLFLSVEVKV